MPSKSKAQQHLFGMAYAAKKDKTPKKELSPNVKKLVESMSKRQLKDFAKTKSKDLPEKAASSDESKEKKVKVTTEDASKQIHSNKTTSMNLKQYNIKKIASVISSHPWLAKHITDAVENAKPAEAYKPKKPLSAYTPGSLIAAYAEKERKALEAKKALKRDATMAAAELETAKKQGLSVPLYRAKAVANKYKNDLLERRDVLMTENPYLRNADLAAGTGLVGAGLTGLFTDSNLAKGLVGLGTGAATYGLTNPEAKKSLINLYNTVKGKFAAEKSMNKKEEKKPVKEQTAKPEAPKSKQQISDEALIGKALYENWKSKSKRNVKKAAEEDDKKKKSKKSGLGTAAKWTAGVGGAAGLGALLYYLYNKKAPAQEGMNVLMNGAKGTTNSGILTKPPTTANNIVAASNKDNTFFNKALSKIGFRDKNKSVLSELNPYADKETVQANLAALQNWARPAKKIIPSDHSLAAKMKHKVTPQGAVAEMMAEDNQGRNARYVQNKMIPGEAASFKSNPKLDNLRALFDKGDAFFGKPGK